MNSLTERVGNVIDVVGAMKDDVEVIKMDIEFIKHDLKSKVARGVGGKLSNEF